MNCLQKDFLLIEKKPRKILKKMHVFKHPKYYDDLRKKRKKFQKEQVDKQASERASRGAGGPTSHEQGSEQASDQASDEDASKQR